ncbi:LysR family transcriptional regulator [Bacillus obstructivus]|uniref:cidABC operon transcriptional activator CidR n=1 Tax=Heyndrickxia TaxID=2837504 RepID=UPI00090397F1|nr:LysR family transcriptional regulator [Heyndrickxia oleronia]OJH16700.1 LysR family transcriptional regulator [Bacillus obstructivus]GIN41684.1 putative HTH-type transcriptional regulator YwbI [Heyndrickxia oleronia]
MDIQHLNYFVAVATEGNFTKAAQKLYVSQPSISKMVKNLEDELGVILFDRTGKHAKLTDAGEKILVQAQNIIKSFQNLRSELDDLMQLKTGIIHIGLPPMVGSRFFPKVIQAFHQHYPNITVQLVEDGAKKIERDVGNGTLDLGAVVLPINEDQFHTFSFVNEKLMVVTHPSHPLSKRKQLQLVDLEAEPFILFAKNFALHDRIIMECVRKGFHPNIIYESSQWDFISEMVAANNGVALLPETICKQIGHDRVSRIPLIDPVIPWHLGIIWRKDRYLSFAAREWIRFTQMFMMREKSQ